MTHEQSIHLQVLADDVVQANIEFDRATRRKNEREAKFNEYLRSIEAEEKPVVAHKD